MESVATDNSGTARLQDTPASILFHYQFTNIDELAVSIPEADVTLTQMSLQPLLCDAMAFAFEGTLGFYFNRPNCTIKAVGDKFANFLIFVCNLYGHGQPIVSHNLLMTEHYLFGFGPNHEVNIVVPGHITHCAVHVHKDVFADCAEALDRSDLNRKYFAPNYLFAPEALPPLRVYLQELYELMRQRSPLLQQRDFQELIVQDFLPLLIAALPMHKDSLKISPRSFQRSQLVRQAETYMQDHLDQPLTLTTLCNALNTSSRALSYGFQEIFGTSPMVYLKVLRLQAVHRSLKNSSSDKTVASIASQFGFWSMGHFSRDYEQMFGELPSDTFKRLYD